MKYETFVEVSRPKIKHLNDLLAIRSLEEMTDKELLEAGANTYDCIGVYEAAFDDGSYITLDVCSGSENYFDDCVWHAANEKHYIVLDCEYEIDDLEIEIEENTYIVKLKYI